MATPELMRACKSQGIDAECDSYHRTSALDALDETEGSGQEMVPQADTEDLPAWSRPLTDETAERAGAASEQGYVQGRTLTATSGRTSVAGGRSHTAPGEDVAHPVQWQPGTVDVGTRRVPPVVDDDTTAQRIFRAHYWTRLRRDLEGLEKTSTTPQAAMYAGSLLRTMREMRDASPNDPFVDIVMAVHDALACHDAWLEYSARQYETALEILGQMVKRPRLDQDDIDQAIVALERVGLDTSPFGTCDDALE